MENYKDKAKMWSEIAQFYTTEAIKKVEDYNDFWSDALQIGTIAAKIQKITNEINEDDITATEKSINDIYELTQEVKIIFSRIANRIKGYQKRKHLIAALNIAQALPAKVRFIPKIEKLYGQVMLLTYDNNYLRANTEADELINAVFEAMAKEQQ